MSIAASGTASFASAAMTTGTADRYGVTDGGKPLKVIKPSFSVKAIGQSTPELGATVTISVTLTANCDFPTGSAVFIVGLTGTQTTDDGVLAVASTDGTTTGLLGTTGAWTQSSGQLVLTAANGGTAQGTACTVTFNLQHAAAEYTPPSVSIAVGIQDGSTALGSILQVAMDPPNAPLLGVHNGANPLVVVLPEFDVRKIGQSNPLASGSNTITVTIQTNVNLAQADSSVVTITGLTGAPDSASLALTSVSNSAADFFTDGASQGKGVLSSETLTLTVHTGQTVAGGTQYVFSFVITNPSAAQDASAVSIAASGTASFPISRGVMTTDNPNRYVTDGGKPLKVIREPYFHVRAIGQSNPFASAQNEITVTLRTDVHLMASDKITITGLLNAHASNPVTLKAKNNDEHLIFSDGKTPGTGAWSAGTLTLTVHTNRTASANTTYILSFEITNPAHAQDDVLVFVEASRESGVAWFKGRSMTTDTKDKYGVLNGGKPMRIVIPTFVTSKVGQSNPRAMGTNQITVTLQTNVDLLASDGATLTISGFANAVANAPVTLTSDGTDGHLRFSDGATPGTGSWNFGALTLKVGTDMIARKMYVFGFQFVNPTAQATAARVSIAASGTTFSIPASFMTTDAAVPQYLAGCEIKAEVNTGVARSDMKACYDCCSVGCRTGPEVPQVGGSDVPPGLRSTTCQRVCLRHVRFNFLLAIDTHVSRAVRLLLESSVPAVTLTAVCLSSAGTTEKSLRAKGSCRSFELP